MRMVFELDGLFDGERVIENAGLVIDGGEVAWVGERRALPKSAPGERSETTKPPASFALPGMINCHAHLTLDGDANFAAEVTQNDTQAALKAFRNARAALRAGVTTVRALGANGTRVIELARAIERALVEGARIIAAGRGITTTGGHGLEVGRIADSVDEVRKAVREQAHAGAKVVKLFSTGGILGGGAPPELSQYSAEETRAAVEEAHKAGLRITTHAHGSGGMRIAAEAGSTRSSTRRCWTRRRSGRSRSTTSRSSRPSWWCSPSSTTPRSSTPSSSNERARCRSATAKASARHIAPGSVSRPARTRVPPSPGMPRTRSRCACSPSAGSHRPRRSPPRPLRRRASSDWATRDGSAAAAGPTSCSSRAIRSRTRARSARRAAW